MLRWSNSISFVHRYTHLQLQILEGHFTAQNIERSDLTKAHRLRHHIFAEQLSWVQRNASNLEIDVYDCNAIHFGVFKTQELLAYLRIIPPKDPFMIENEFIDLIRPGYNIRKLDDTGEVSRLCISPLAHNYPAGSTYIEYGITMLLSKCVYHWCHKNGVRFLYFVVAKEVLRLLRVRGFPYRLIGTPKIMPDGTRAVAAILDWRNFEKQNASKRPKMLEWFRRGQSG